MRITKARLRDLNACPDQVAIFAREWPLGANVTHRNAQRAVELGLDIDWFAGRILNAPALAAYGQATTLARAAYEQATAAYNRAKATAWRAYQQAWGSAFVSAAIEKAKP